MTPVVIVGLMGAGKSSVGALVATATGRPFVDVDLAIEAGTGKTVRELWEEGGEPAYRHLESQAVLKTLERGDDVVLAALGAAFVVWLRADPATLATRVEHDDHRPLLGDRPFEVLTSMAAERDSLYGSVADLVVDTDGRDADTVAAAVLDELDRRRLNT